MRNIYNGNQPKNIYFYTNSYGSLYGPYIKKQKHIIFKYENKFELNENGDYIRIKE